MPGRKITLETGEFYHIFNRGVARMPTFVDTSDFERAIQLINYYRYAHTPIRYSRFLTLSQTYQEAILTSLEQKSEKLVEIISFVLMPNHFHFTLYQSCDGGISKFISDFTNSYTKYVNTKKDRPGPIFQGTFKSVLVESEEQLIHLTRYHHLNPYKDNLITTVQELTNYPYSSFKDYIGVKVFEFVDPSRILTNFKSKETYKQFVLNQRDYQRKLARIKKIMID